MTSYTNRHGLASYYWPSLSLLAIFNYTYKRKAVVTMTITTSQTAAALLENDKFLLIAHTSPDGDSLGGTFALYYALTAMGKRVKIRCSDPLPERFAYLYEGYIEDDFMEDFVVAVDVAALQLLGDELSSYSKKVDICIDHHPSNGLYAKRTCLEADATATCTVVYEILTILNADITKAIANCIYTGIATDSGCFKYSNTTPKAHRIAADLIEMGADYEEINRFLFDTKSKSRLLIEQQVLNTVEFFFDDRVAMIIITREMVDKSHADEAELDGVSSLPRMIEGVDVGITIRERIDGSHKVSLRTSKSADASEICQEFGGGGHMRAAGCLIFEPIDIVKSQLLEVVSKYVL